MKALKVILVVVVVIVGAYAIWMATIDPEYHVERSVVIDAEPETVYGTVSDFKTWSEWSKWHKMDPDMEVTYGEVSAGEGASYTWKGEKAGAGTQKITAAVPNKSLDTHIAFEGMGESTGRWEFEPTADKKTEVTWSFDGEMPFFLRVMSLGMDQSVGADFEEGLANLKEKVESMPKPAKAPKVEISTVEVESYPYFGIRHDISWEEMSHEFFQKNYDKIANYAGGENITGPAFAIFEEWDEENERAVMVIAMPVNSNKPGTDEIKKGTSYSGKALKAVHMQGFETGLEHTAMGEYMKEQNLEMVGSPWEIYHMDPNDEQNQSKWSAEVYYPIAKSGQASMTETEESGKS